jgi:hypothetical protein
MSIDISSVAPGFRLEDTYGEEWGPIGGAATVVVFTCNHCPYALAWHERLLQVARDYAGRSVRMLMICSNDAERYPHDGPEAMRERVERDGGWPAAYLHDPTQEVAAVYGATVTPEVYVLDDVGKLRYRGAPDGDHDDPSLNAEWLREALDAVLDGKTIATAVTQAVGCTIKWR